VVANPFVFLGSWIREHVNATAYDDKPAAEFLADSCLRAAKKAGVSEASVIKAAGGNLADYMLSELNSLADREVQRLAKKD
jgi:hypothetical protein